MRFTINEDEYTASDTSYSSYSYSTESISPLSNPSTSNNTTSTYHFISNAREVLSPRRSVVSANNVFAVSNDIELNIYDNDNSVSDSEESNYIKLYGYNCTKLLSITMIFIYLINCILNNSLSNGYDNFTVLTYRTLSGYPECKSIQNEVWRLFTSTLIHNNLTHLLGNILFLFIYGYHYENIYGCKKMLLVFFSGAYCGSLSSAYINRYTISLGASHAIFSINGALLSSVIANNDVFSFKLSIRSGLVSLLGIILEIITYTNYYSDTTGYIAHWGGCINGFLIGAYYSNNNFNDSKWKHFWRTTALNCFILLNTFLTIDYILHDNKNNVMNEKFQEIDFKSCCHHKLNYDDDNIICVNKLEKLMLV